MAECTVVVRETRVRFSPSVLNVNGSNELGESTECNLRYARHRFSPSVLYKNKFSEF